MDTADICEAKAQAHREEILEECICSEEAQTEFDSAMQDCAMRDTAEEV